MSTAAWLFNLTKIGDPVIVKGTERSLDPANGWTAWDLPWKDYVAGSALPHPPVPDPARGGPARPL